ncbi:MAG: NAD(P)-dependent oxidoreductase [Armatimonadota bacterium]
MSDTNGPATIVFVEVAPWEQEYIEGNAEQYGWDIEMYEEEATELPEEARENVEILSCFINSDVNADFIDDCPNLKHIATRSTGYDHIDTDRCRERGIVVSNVPQYGENTVAEHTMGLILTLSRHIHTAVDRVKRGDFSVDGLLGFDLYGKTLGVIGAGRIGLHVIRMGNAMNMRVIAHDVNEESLFSEVLNFEYVDLDTVLREADILTIHVPLIPATHHLLDAEKLSKMKDGVLIVNTSRGGVIDSNALLDALNDGPVAGVALDVLEGEQVFNEDRVLAREEVSPDELRLAVEAYQLIHHPKVIVTPHIAFYSEEALERIVDTSYENIQHFLDDCPSNTVGDTGGEEEDPDCDE